MSVGCNGCPFGPDDVAPLRCAQRLGNESCSCRAGPNVIRHIVCVCVCVVRNKVQKERHLLLFFFWHSTHYTQTLSVRELPPVRANIRLDGGGETQSRGEGKTKQETRKPKFYFAAEDQRVPPTISQVLPQKTRSASSGLEQQKVALVQGFHRSCEDVVEGGADGKRMISLPNHTP